MRRLLLALLVLLLPGVVAAQTQWQINNALFTNACTTSPGTDILGVDQGSNIFGVAGDVSATFRPGGSAVVAGSHLGINDGQYQVVNVTVVPFPFPNGQTLVQMSLARPIADTTQPFGTMALPGGGSCTGSSPITYVRDFQGAGITPLTRTQIQAAINGALAGGIVQFDCAGYTLDGISISITKSLTLQGCGIDGTFLSAPDSGEDVIQVNTSGRLTFRDFSMNASGKTGGAYIHLMGTNSGLVQVDRMAFIGHLIALDLEAGNLETVSNSYFVSRHNAGTNDIYIHSTIADSGPQMIYNNIFDQYAPFPCGGGQCLPADNNPNALGNAILYTSGGGATILGNSILNHSISVNITWGAIGSSEIKIVGNTFDAQSTPPLNQDYGIILTSTGTGGVNGITITSNSFIGFKIASISSAGGSSPQLMANVTIVGNSFAVNDGAIGIQSGWAGAIISSNNFISNGTTPTGVVVNAGASNNLVSGNNFAGTWASKTNNASGSSAVGVFSGSCQNGIVVSGTGC